MGGLTQKSISMAHVVSYQDRSHGEQTTVCHAIKNTTREKMVLGGPIEHRWHGRKRYDGICPSTKHDGVYPSMNKTREEHIVGGGHTLTDNMRYIWNKVTQGIMAIQGKGGVGGSLPGELHGVQVWRGSPRQRHIAWQMRCWGSLCGETSVKHMP